MFRVKKEKGPWLGKPRARVAAIEVWVFGGGGTAAEEIVVVLFGSEVSATSDTPNIHGNWRRVELSIAKFFDQLNFREITLFLLGESGVVPPLDTWAWPVVAISVGYPRSPEFPHAKTRKASHHDGRRPP